MSESTNTASPQSSESAPLLQQENIPTGTIAWVGLGSLALFAAGIYASYLLLINRRIEAQAEGKSEIPAAIERREPELGIVDQHPFTLEHRAADQKKAVEERLESYGWVDKGRGVIHVPVSEAMKQVLAAQPGQPR